MRPYSKGQKLFARELRARLTDAEQKLWQHLRRKQLGGVQFYRQKPIGPYIVDFYCAAFQLVIELDGGQHFEVAHMARDAARDAALVAHGLLVLRFDNLQVLKETEAVLEIISQTLMQRTAQQATQSGPPPLQKGD